MADFVEITDIDENNWLVNTDQIQFMWVDEKITNIYFVGTQYPAEFPEEAYQELKNTLHIVQLRNPVQSVEKDNDAESQ